jgi:hypothetical protein
MRLISRAQQKLLLAYSHEPNGKKILKKRRNFGQAMEVFCYTKVVMKTGYGAHYVPRSLHARHNNAQSMRSGRLCNEHKKERKDMLVRI